VQTLTKCGICVGDIAKRGGTVTSINMPSTAGAFVDVKADFSASGNGQHDDSESIRSALAAAVAETGPGVVWFPPGVYLVSPQEPGHRFCLDVPDSNVQLRGVKGRSWIKAGAGLNAAIHLLHIEQKAHVTIRDLGIDGNWGNARTEVAARIHNATLPTATLFVKDTSGFPDSGSCIVVGADGTPQQISYTGRTPTSFTGCTGGSGRLSVGSAVGYIDANTGINHATLRDPQCHGIMIRGSSDVLVDNCLIRQCYGDGIWLGPSAEDIATPASNIKIVNTDIDMSARSGIAIGGSTDTLYVAQCRFTNIFAQAFDTEPVGTNGFARNVTLDNVFLDGWWNPANPKRSVNSPLSIQGGASAFPNESNRARQYRVRNCTINGSALITDAVDVVFEHNRVICDFAGLSYSPVMVEMDCDDIWILDNYIYDRTIGRGGEAHDASVSVQFYASGPLNEQPAGVHVRGNRIHARHGRHGIKVEGTGTFALGTGAQMPNRLGTAAAISGATTTISIASDHQMLPQPTLNVDSTSGFPDTGRLVIVTHSGIAEVSYTSVDRNLRQFQGCSGGSVELIAGDHVSSYTLTDPTAIWAIDQWRGKVVRVGGAQGTVMSNTPSQLSLDSSGWRTTLGNPAVTPDPGTYSIYGSSAFVDVENNTVECTDDGFGPGGCGIVLMATRAGTRVRCRSNQIINAAGDAIRVVSTDQARPFAHLELMDNVAIDTQPARTCLRMLSFTNFQGQPANPQVQRWIMRGNAPGIYADGTRMPDFAGLSSSVAWMMSGGSPTEWAGFGSPEGFIAADVGSTYLRLDGAVGSTMYVKEAASGTAGWRAMP
jgi:pectate lyase-like protein